jgi:phenylpropionate dioxygenase-like ring-hydroxylating dioxygenase large terminal subunit
MLRPTQWADIEQAPTREDAVTEAVSQAEQSTKRRGAAIEFRGAGEFHACWYPVALSDEVPGGKVIGAQFLDGRVVVYRSEDGAAHVQSAYCRHLGADLSRGELVDGKLQCPFHHWRYDGAGRCVEIPAGDRPPAEARLFCYPTAESLGVIWAFNGDAPTHPAPHFSIAESDLVVDTFRNPNLMPVDSAAVFLNSFDIQHFRAVHGLDIEVDPEDTRAEHGTLSYVAKVNAAEFGAIVQRRKLWGVSTVTIESEKSGQPVLLLHALCPIGGNKTLGVLVNATLKATTASDTAAIKQTLTASRDYSLRLVNEDAPIFETMRMRWDCLTGADRFLAFGVNYIKTYPCAHPGREMIR